MEKIRTNGRIKHLEDLVGRIPRPESEVFDSHRPPEVFSFADIRESAVTVNDADL